MRTFAANVLIHYRKTIAAALLAIIALALISLFRLGGAAADELPAVSSVQDDVWRVQASLAGPAHTLQPTKLSVTVNRLDGSPVDNATFHVSLSMPSMFCGTSRVDMKQVRPGVYEGDGIPLMAGKTEAAIEIQTSERHFQMNHIFIAAR